MCMFTHEQNVRILGTFGTSDFRLSVSCGQSVTQNVTQIIKPHRRSDGALKGCMENEGRLFSKSFRFGLGILTPESVRRSPQDLLTDFDGIDGLIAYVSVCSVLGKTSGRDPQKQLLKLRDLFSFVSLLEISS